MVGNPKEERGPKVPGVNLSNAVEMLRKVREGVGTSRASRETVAHALGYKGLSGSANRAIGALVHFGLLDRTGAGALGVSDLGRRILHPTNDVESASALAEAAMSPSLYQKLFSRFSGQGLPGLLPNILVRDYGLLPGSSEDVARTFRESAEFAGLLRNGVLETALSVETDASAGIPRDAPSRVVDAGEPERSSPLPSRTAVDTQRYTIPLDSEGRVGTIDIPLPVRAADLRRIRRWAEYMASLTEDEGQ